MSVYNKYCIESDPRMWCANVRLTRSYHTWHGVCISILRHCSAGHTKAAMFQGTPHLHQEASWCLSLGKYVRTIWHQIFEHNFSQLEALNLDLKTLTERSVWNGRWEDLHIGSGAWGLRAKDIYKTSWTNGKISDGGSASVLCGSGSFSSALTWQYGGRELYAANVAATH